MKIFFQILAGISLFFTLSNIAIVSLLNNGIEVPQEVSLLLLLYKILAVISACYIGLLLYRCRALIRRRIMQLALLFFVYSIIHVFIALTKNIGVQNSPVNLLFVENNLFSSSYSLFLIGFLLVIFILFLFEKIRRKFVKPLKKERQKFEVKFVDLFVFLLSSLIFLDSFMIRFFQGVILPGMKVFTLYNFIRLVFDQFLIFVVIVLVSVAIYQGVRSLAGNRPSFSLSFLSSLCFALIFNYTIQRGSLSTNSLIAGAFLFQVLVLTMMFMLIYVLINRYVVSSLIIIVLFTTFSIANAIKVTEREEPIYLSDLSWLKNPSILLSFVKLSSVIMLLVFLIIICAAAFILGRRFFKGALMSWKVRLATFITLVVLFIPLANNFLNYQVMNGLPKNAEFTKQLRIPMLTTFINSDLPNIWLGNAAVSSRDSLSFVWLRTAFGKIMESPENYSSVSIDKIEKKYQHEAEQINSLRIHKIKDQTVIFVLSESLSNPVRIPGVTVSKNPLENIDRIKQQNAGGLMLSTNYGGGTVNLEMQSLTGLPLSFFTQNVVDMNTDVIPQMPFIPSISNEFKNKIVLHPENAANYDRNAVYERLGFQHFYALHGTTKADTLTGQEMLDGRVDDKQTYQDVLGKIDAKQAQFFSVLTMQNHMPYDTYSGETKIKANSAAFTETVNNQLQNYTNMVNITDQATQNFLDALKKINKKITVVFYGDHLPGFYPSATFIDKPKVQYQTDYFIWTNKSPGKSNMDTVNASEFTAKVLEATDSKVSPYQALLTEVMQKVPAEFDTRFSGDLKLNAEQKQLISDLKMVQYDLTVGKHYLTGKSSFFKIR